MIGRHKAIVAGANRDVLIFLLKTCRLSVPKVLKYEINVKKLKL